MNAPTSQAVREDFDEQHTLVMPNRPSAHFASGVMPTATPYASQAQAASGVMPVAQPYAQAQPDGYPFGYETPPSEGIPTADVLASYPPATAEPTPLPIPLGSLAPTSLSEPLTAYQGSYAFQSAPSDGRGRVAFIILLGFLIGIGGTYSYQVVKHSPSTSAAATTPEVAKPVEPKAPVAKEASPAASAKPAPPLPDAKPELKAEAPTAPKPVDAKPPTKAAAPAKTSPRAVTSPETKLAETKPAEAKSDEAKSVEPSTRPKPPRQKKARTEPNLEGRDLLNEGLD